MTDKEIIQMFKDEYSSEDINIGHGISHPGGYAIIRVQCEHPKDSNFPSSYYGLEVKVRGFAKPCTI